MCLTENGPVWRTITPPLAAETPKGAILVARAEGLGDAKLPCRSPLVKQSDMLSLVAGEYEETSFLSSRLVTKTPETARTGEAGHRRAPCPWGRCSMPRTSSR